MKKYLNFAAWTLVSLLLTWMVRCAVHDNGSKKEIDPAEALIKYHDRITNPNRYMNPSQ